MKELILKWLELKKIKYNHTYCNHEWEEKESWNLKNVNTGIKRDGAIKLYICKKCGKFKKFELMD